jgi:hypothetical protein
MLEAVNVTLGELQREYDACGCGSDACAAEVAEYGMGLHVAGIFILLLASALGVMVPLLIKHCQRWVSVPAFAVVVGKCVGTGVVLSVALVHMLPPATDALSSPCLPTMLTDNYSAWSFMFTLSAALLMHWLELMLEGIMRGQSKNECDDGTAAIPEKDAAPSDERDARGASRLWCSAPSGLSADRSVERQRRREDIDRGEG